MEIKKTMKKIAFKPGFASGILAAAVAMLALGLASCGDKNQKVLDKGRLDGNIYYNSYFDFRMDVPEKWHIYGRQELEQANREAVEAIPNKVMKEQMERVMALQSVQLLTMFQSEPGTAEGFIPSIQVVAENLKWLPNVKTGEHYLKQALEVFVASGAPYKELDVPIILVRLGGRDFYKMKLEADYGEYVVGQEWYSAVIDGFALNFGFTYDILELKQGEEMAKIRSSITFSPDMSERQ